MTDQNKFIDFMKSEENSKEVKNIFSNFKKLFYEVKLGYDHALVLTNTENKKTWISSTNNLKDRRKTLERILKEKDRKSWYEPWLITFGSLGNDIMNKVDIEPYEDIGKIPNKKFIDMTIPKDQVENIKEMFIKLTSEYIKIDHASKGKEIRQLIDGHFNLKNNREPISDLINKIDKSLN
tara:strand:- start:329 stop:868 length:540 start_codon:yes stop_codon:yes gene_type:complete